MNDHTLFIAAHNGPAPIPMVPLEYGTERPPIVIDNGATSFRYGFAGGSPFSWLNSVSRYRERKTNKPILLFGDATNLDATSRAQSKQPWEGDLLLNFDALENAFDHAFIHLGVDTDTVEHPILMTERLATPLHSRALTSELLFEAYGTPSVAYCVDSLMSLHQTLGPSQPLADSLVVSFNTSSTSVIPISGGRALLGYARRIPYGGSQASEFLLKLAQIKYPNFPAKVTKEQCTTMRHKLCEVALDYTDKLRELADPEKMADADRIVQFPFVAPNETEKTEEELARQAEKKREAGRRLQEMAVQKRLEKLARKEEDLRELQELRDFKFKEKKGDFLHRIRMEGIESEEMLESTIKKLENDIKKARKKDGDTVDEPQEEPTFPLIDVPDEDLNEDELKEKRRQKLLKAGYEARLRARKEKEAARKEKEEEERREMEERTADPIGWASKLKEDHELLVDKLKLREKRKAALADRKSTINMNRMKSIANLASEEPANKKRKKGTNSDMFGANDEDWAIYRKINIAVESSDEEDDIQQLALIESKLLQHDPTFTSAHTYAALKQQKSALLNAFRPSYDHADPDPNPNTTTRTRDIEGAHRLHLNVERWRVPEVWFQPGIAGIDAAGLGEVIGSLLHHTRCGKIFITGGPAQTRGMRERIEACVRPLLDPEMPVSVLAGKHLELDAWRGMDQFARTEEFSKVVVTKAEYEEWGGERIRRWWGGNWNNAF
ncbi:Chromatin remodeling complex subunit [Ceratobasidium theobromae]|uniref:Chromatin remodeling complex subunit n=1 Tax=Ceratobasidium theobromae TaxID=1582974 RepID=A0A5N5QRH0_9AGAM|nr:Chromatin remodeling complex subunit [Ceratobasidium theobromae]